MLHTVSYKGTNWLVYTGCRVIFPLISLVKEIHSQHSWNPNTNKCRMSTRGDGHIQLSLHLLKMHYHTLMAHLFVWSIYCIKFCARYCKGLFRLSVSGGGSVDAHKEYYNCTIQTEWRSQWCSKMGPDPFHSFNTDPRSEHNLIILLMVYEVNNFNFIWMKFKVDSISKISFK